VSSSINTSLPLQIIRLLLPVNVIGVLMEKLIKGFNRTKLVLFTTASKYFEISMVGLKKTINPAGFKS
jgi:hypothetical protein